MERYSFEQLLARTERFEKTAGSGAVKSADINIKGAIKLTQHLHGIGVEISKNRALGNVGTDTVMIFCSRILEHLGYVEECLSEISGDMDNEFQNKLERSE